MTVKTEDTGKIFERAICLAYDIPYDGKYKYGLEEPTRLAPRLARLTELFPPCTHTGTTVYAASYAVFCGIKACR